MPEESIIERIKKLMALALNNPHPAEAAAAMTKATELIQKHAIDESKLRGKDAPPLTEVIRIDIGRRLEGWMKIVNGSVAQIYDAYYITAGGYGKDVGIFICADYDAELLKETQRFVVATILREAARVTRGRTMADSFRSGAAVGFSDAVKAAAPAPLTKPGTAIILARREMIMAKKVELFPSAKSRPVKVNTDDAGAYNAGYKLGASLSTGKASKKLEE